MNGNFNLNFLDEDGYGLGARSSKHGGKASCQGDQGGGK